MERLRKILLLMLAALCLGGAGWMQEQLNADRDALGLTRRQPLENAPPVLAFTTLALGGFRGLISNALWMRANELQQEGKYFEMAQLADWITKLEPGFAAVWTVQAWNMAYNISVKFKDNPPGDFSAASNCCATKACATIPTSLCSTSSCPGSSSTNWGTTWMTGTCSIRNSGPGKWRQCSAIPTGPTSTC